MPQNTKAIKTRIKSVRNTKKITKAMEMVSAAKMRRAVAAALSTRPYAAMARTLMEHLSELQEAKDELLATRPVRHILLVFISSNRGLCGSYNSNLFKRIGAILADKINLGRHRVPGAADILPAGEVAVSVLGIGKKSAAFAKRNSYPLVAVFDTLTEQKDLAELLPVARLIMDEFRKGTYDKVVVAYTDYVSSLAQEPKIRQLLPISPVDLHKMLERLGGNQAEVETENSLNQYPIEEYIFEPGIEAILHYILPRLVEVQLYQAVLESAASEHSARMLAMRNASDAAGEMIDELQLSSNKARQAGITQQIAEIAAGAAALG